jgi:Predicted O-methyltransferase
MGLNLTVNREIEEYINKNSINFHPVQKEIITHNEELGDIKRMQISVSQCHFLHLLIKTSKIKKILEIGTFTGLSTLSMSLALPEDGSILALDKNHETSKIAVNFFKKASQNNKIKLIIAPALESLKNLNDNKQKFDLIFIDADKENYLNYFNRSVDLIDKDGLIVIDNVLWHGEVVNVNKQDKLTLSIREFNSYVNKDKRVENLIIPLGDGLSVCRKL